MKDKLKVLLAGRNATDLQQLETHLKSVSWIELAIKTISNGHSDPLHNVADMPQALVFCVGAASEDELLALSNRPAEIRVPSLVVGADGNLAALRAAMRAGARDYLSQPVEGDELIAALGKIATERSFSHRRVTKMTAVVNAKGGCGATLVACNLAHVMAAYGGIGTTVIDLDLQFGMLPLYLDIPAQDGMIQALRSAGDLDDVALQALTERHGSGLRVLGAMTEEVVLPSEVDVDSVKRVLAIAARFSDHIFIDLPRQIDAVTNHLFEQASQILVVTQQSVTDLRQAKRLMSILLRDLSIPPEQVRVVVNRYDPKSMVTTKDIERSLGCGTPATIPNDFKHVAESVNLGVPLYDLAPKSAISKALLAIADGLSGKPKVTRGRFFRRQVSTFGQEAR